MKTKTLYAICTIAVLGALAQRAEAYELNLSATPEDTHVVSSSVGVENAFVTSAGYGYTLRLFDRSVLLGGDITMPWAKLDLADFRLRLGGLVPVVGNSRWKVLAELMPVLRSSKGLLSRLTSVGVELGVIGGYYGQRWFAAAELGADWAALTYVEHLDRYRESFYADAKDGWYRSVGGTVRAGLFGGYSFEAFDVVLRAGQQRDLQLNTLMLPLYLTVGINARLPI